MSSWNARELKILSILLHGELFGRQIRMEYEKRTKSSMPIGSLYTTLDRMEAKGFIKSREGEPNPEYGGNRRRFYKLTASGSRKLDEIAAQLGLGGFANG